MENKTALITGADSGMGLEFARQFAAMGYAVAMISNREKELKAAAKEIEDSYDVPVKAFCLDLAQTGAAEKVMEWCDANCIGPDILVNNAGIFFMEYLKPELLPKVKTMMALHMNVVTELCVLVGTRMKGHGGHILNMSSMTARIPAPGIAIYSATKAYLKSFGKSFSYEMKPFGVSVTTVCPAAVDTGLYPLGDKLRNALKKVGIIRSPQWLVRRSIKAMFRGRRTFSPGLTNKILPPLIGLLPARLIDRLGVKWILR